MLTEVFIRRPILTSVIAILTVLAGIISIPTLPISQYPQIAPPQVTVTTQYIGASAEVVESAVTTILEQAINGVEGIRYMTSTSSNDGNSNISVVFNQERNLDLAAVDVQNRVSTALARLPNEVKNTGVNVTKNSNALVLVIGLYDKDKQYSPLFVSNYADRYIRDALKRIKGVSDVTVFGERKYAMRLWLDPVKLVSRGLTAVDVIKSLQEQNVQVAAGQIGQPPIATDQAFQMSVRAKGRLENASEFENIILKSTASGAQVRLKDVGYVKLGAENYATNLRFNGQDAVGIGIYQLPTANALSVANEAREVMANLEAKFPPGLITAPILDTTVVVQESMRDVILTLLIAIALVIAVMFVFLQNWRSILIPAITIPVSLIGTFVFVKFFGFSINTLIMFGLTLATGLVVDDAIVVVENVERLMSEKDMSPLDAAVASMKEVSGALIAISLVLIAVFVPVAFYPGTTGQLYKQFALTIAFSMTLSTVNALTLTPALSAILLKKPHSESEKAKLYQWFDKGIHWLKTTYAKTLDKLLTVKPIVIGCFVFLMVLSTVLFKVIPNGFVPNEDQSYFIINVQGPEGVSINYTHRVVDKIQALVKKQPEVRGVTGISGFSFFGNGPNKAICFVALKPLDTRHGAEHSAKAVLNRLRGPLVAAVPDAMVIPFEAPAIQGLGRFGGIQLEILDESGHTLDELASATWGLVGGGNKQASLTGLFSAFNTATPQLKVTVDRELAKALDVQLTDIFSTLQLFLGSIYVNDFDFLNRVYRVYAQADQAFRANPQDIGQFYVRSGRGEMVPLQEMTHVERTYVPQSITHFNLFRSAEINGSAKPGFSTGQAMDDIEHLAKKMLPSGMSTAWAGISLEQKESGAAAFFIFSLSLIVVYLVLAALYESFLDPVIILLAVPLAVFGALLAQWIRGLENDVFCQIGLVMLIGMASKNAILIVEFANQLRRQQQKSIVEAAIEAAKIRFRPIMMTSLAFIFGIFPLVVATGAGAAARNSMGTAVFGGMILSTLLSIFLIPVLYIVLNLLQQKLRNQLKTSVPSHS